MLPFKEGYMHNLETISKSFSKTAEMLVKGVCMHPFYIYKSKHGVFCVQFTDVVNHKLKPGRQSGLVD